MENIEVPSIEIVVEEDKEIGDTIYSTKIYTNNYSIGAYKEVRDRIDT